MQSQLLGVTIDWTAISVQPKGDTSSLLKGGYVYTKGLQDLGVAKPELWCPEPLGRPRLPLPYSGALNRMAVGLVGAIWLLEMSSSTRCSRQRSDEAGVVGQASFVSG